jgi:hypothetical protein
MLRRSTHSILARQTTAFCFTAANAFCRRSFSSNDQVLRDLTQEVATLRAEIATNRKNNKKNENKQDEKKPLDCLDPYAPFFILSWNVTKFLLYLYCFLWLCGYVFEFLRVRNRLAERELKEAERKEALKK